MAVRNARPGQTPPTAANGFVGREPELRRIADLLHGDAQLITLVGPGGIGKTRLADESAHRYQTKTGAAAHWVRLARLARDSDAGAIEHAGAQAVVTVDVSGRSAQSVLRDALASRSGGRTMLVLDNCEHVLTGAGEFVDDLLAAIPDLIILATSRQPLGWVDEHLVTVPPLTRRQARVLFLQRAGLLALAVDDSDTVGRICQHVHDHPLYIRLAAARLRRRPLAAILAELSGRADDRRMRWSHGPRVGADTRHQSVGDVIAWSYDLCTDAERLLLDRMSVFAAGYDANPQEGADVAEVGTDIEAIVTVCGGDGLDPAEIEGLLEELVERSLVSLQLTGRKPRYFLLETIRLFAQQQLAQRSPDVDEFARLARRHRRYYRDKVAHAQLDWFGPRERQLMNWTRAAWDDILVAIEGSVVSPAEAAVGLQISIGLVALGAPFVRGSLCETRHWTERALAATAKLDPPPVELQIRAWAAVTWMALNQGEHSDAERALDECVALCVADLDLRATWRSTPERDIGLPAAVEFAWGASLMLVHRDARAITVLSRAEQKFTDRQRRGGQAMSGLLKAQAAAFLGSKELALEVTGRHVDHAAKSGAAWALARAELARAIALTRHGSPAEAAQLARAVLAKQYADHDSWGAIWAVHVRSWALAQLIRDAAHADRRRQRELAAEVAHLIGAARTYRDYIGVSIEGLLPFADEIRRATAVARETLGDNLFDEELAKGVELRPEHGEVLQLALGMLPVGRITGRATSNPQPHLWDELTSAEHQVALLAAAGWTNGAIADRRGNSVKTVDAQMLAILQKLLIKSRSDIIDFVPEALLPQVRAETARRPHRRLRPPRLS
ncbi:MAG: LuxR family transcriptional regulator [Mycobacteriaceae bacterium]|nr:LuxR family transcriptional regulator [Mycobacteriaceae bacterium]